MSAFSLPNSGLWYAFMAGRYKEQVEQNVARARAASDRKSRGIYAKHARSTNHTMIEFLRRARGAA